MISVFQDRSQTSNATQMNKPGKYVAFEDLGGFEKIGEERVIIVFAEGSFRCRKNERGLQSSFK